MSESLILKNILLKFGSKLNMRLFRNNVGCATTSTGGFVKFGLCPGSSDLIGITSLVITKDMIGKTVGVFTAIEVKNKGGRVSDEQMNFINIVKERGGFAGIAKSNKDVEEIISPENL
jgi:hypothetical protein